MQRGSLCLWRAPPGTMDAPMAAARYAGDSGEVIDLPASGTVGDQERRGVGAGAVEDEGPHGGNGARLLIQ